MSILEGIFGKRVEAKTNLSSRVEKQEDANVIQTFPKLNTKKLGGGINVSQFVTLKGDGAVVFKSYEGQDDQTIKEYKTERAAYLVDEFLGFDLIPPTVIRTIDGKIGSAQRFISDATHACVRDEFGTFTDSESLQRDQSKLLVLDFILWNTDRHGENYLIKDERIIAIDHGRSFVCREIDNCVYPVNNFKLSGTLVQNLVTLFSNAKKVSQLRQSLMELLPEDQVNACLERIEYVAQSLKMGGDLDWAHLFEYQPPFLLVDEVKELKKAA